MSDVTAPAGAIHDIGYQRYTGPRLGRAYARRSLYVHSLRTAFGLGRSGKAKIFPWISAGILVLVAVIIDAIRSKTGVLGVSYIDFPVNTALLTLLFVATAAPELVSRDLRSKVLPLYFSRPLRRSDYVFAKLAAMMSALWLLLAVPLFVIFLGGAFSLPAGQIWREFTDFGGGLIAAAIIAILYSSVALLIASLLNRRMVAAAVIAVVFLVTLALGGAVMAIVGGSRGQEIAGLFGPFWLTRSLNEWLFQDDPHGFGTHGWAYLIASFLLAFVCGWLMLIRYRKASA